MKTLTVLQARSKSDISKTTGKPWSGVVIAGYITDSETGEVQPFDQLFFGLSFVPQPGNYEPVLEPEIRQKNLVFRLASLKPIKQMAPELTAKAA